MNAEQLLAAYLEHVEHTGDELSLVERPEPSLAARLDARRRRDQEAFDQRGLPRTTVTVVVA